MNDPVIGEPGAMSVGTIVAVVLALAILTAVGLVERRIRLDLAEERRRGVNRRADDRLNDLAALGQSCLSALLLGFAPTVLLVLTYEFAPVAQAERIFVSTATFGFAVLAATVFRLIKPLPKPSRFPWRNLLILVMAGLTVVLRDDLFLKIRPTIASIMAALLALADLSGLNPHLDTWFDRHRNSLDEAGRRKLLLGVVLDGLLYAALNVYIWQTATESFWIYFQLWGPLLFFGMFTGLAYLFLKDHLPARQCSVRQGAAPTEANDAQ